VDSGFGCVANSLVYLLEQMLRKTVWLAAAKCHPSRLLKNATEVRFLTVTARQVTANAGSRFRAARVSKRFCAFSAAY
jgi:hypothetical protein